MSGLVHAHPITVLRHPFDRRDANYPFTLAPCLDAPLSGSDRRRYLPYDFLALCSELELYLEAYCQPPYTWRGEWEQTPTTADICSRLDSLMSALDPLTSACSYMESQHLSTFFPYTHAYLAGEAPVRDDDHVHVEDYFATMALFNQIVSLCRQLRDDLDKPTHKYYAHQIALLYQSIGGMGSLLSDFKKEIEGKFDAIKKEVEGGEHVKLSLENQDWIVGLTSDIEDLIANFPRELSRRVRPIMQFVAAHPVPGLSP